MVNNPIKPRSSGEKDERGRLAGRVQDELSVIGFDDAKIVGEGNS